MSNELIEGECLLCGGKARYNDSIDYGNRRLYICDEINCGDYEIPKSLIRRIENSTTMRVDFQQRAMECRNGGKVLEIIEDSKGILNPKCKDVGG